MQIPPFALPSNPERQITFREATVADCEQFADSNPAHSERLTTKILNALQPVPEHYSNSGEWTIEDRVVAVFWYYSHTTIDTSIHLPYICPHCGGEHDALVELSKIAEGYQSIQGASYRLIEHNGEQYEVRPLNGYAAEELEILKAEAGDDKKSANYSRVEAIMRRHQVVSSMRPVEFRGTRDSLIKKMEKLVREMPLSSFEQLRKKVAEKHKEMTHGLPCESSDGRTLLITPPVGCDKEAGKTTRLRFPFLSSDYLPRLQ